MTSSTNEAPDSTASGGMPALYVFEESKTFPIRKRGESGFVRLALVCREHGVLDVREDFLEEFKRCGGDIKHERGFKRNRYGRPHCSLSEGYVGNVAFGSPEKAMSYLKQYFILIAPPNNSVMTQERLDSIPARTPAEVQSVPRCLNCLLWDEDERCRVNPPVFLPTANSGYNEQGFWPKTKKDDWCGAFRPKVSEEGGAEAK